MSAVPMEHDVEDGTLITAGGLARLEQELEGLRDVGRRELAERCRAARNDGDVTENPALIDLLEEHGQLERRIAVPTQVANARVVAPSRDGVAGLGTSSLRDNATGEVAEYELVGAVEANVGNGRVSLALRWAGRVDGRATSSTSRRPWDDRARGARRTSRACRGAEGRVRPAPEPPRPLELRPRVRVVVRRRAPRRDACAVALPAWPPATPWRRRWYKRRHAGAGRLGRRQRTGPGRLRSLIDAGIALNSELSLDALLQRLVEIAAELADARYAALGVIDPAGHSLERFFTTGIDLQTYEAIGELPRGRGMLGVLIREAKTLRLHDIADDPRSVGFPRNHPSMRTFLGVPIVLRGVAYGNLYLTEKAGGQDFTSEDEELTQLLAAQAAVAIENARLYESSTRWLRQLEGLNEIGAALASEVELEPLLDLVARRMRELVGARIVLIALPDARGSLAVRAAAGRDDLVGIAIDQSASKVGRVLERGQTERVDAMVDDPEVDQRVARELGVTSAMYLPLTVRGAPIGVVVVHDKLGTTRASTSATSVWPSRSCRAPRSPSTSRSASAATRYDAPSTPRSSSGRGSRGSCTMRRARR